MTQSRVSKSIDYLGTPDDQRMVKAFGEYFGEIHIGTGAKSSGDRVTDLEFIRWRTTLYGADGQIEIETKKRLLEEAKKSKADAARSELLLPPQGVMMDVRVTALAAVVVEGSEVQTFVSSRKGKRCSNPECPEKSRYNAALSKVWSKCKKECTQCEGAIHICPNEDCKKFLHDHKARYGL